MLVIGIVGFEAGRPPQLPFLAQLCGKIGVDTFRVFLGRHVEFQEGGHVQNGADEPCFPIIRQHRQDRAVNPLHELLTPVLIQDLLIPLHVVPDEQIRTLSSPFHAP